MLNDVKYIEITYKPTDKPTDKLILISQNNQMMNYKKFFNQIVCDIRIQIRFQLV